ncbi:hypothetical protein NP233_g476 [Leucocoprinus birnbaumii]|uniref:F-box domain-containing protein n=1 Tax=Leucocoprinus birnbaumii TaxID=56174 RepID=A0AAD5W497_9AGAR|nr:hypothetical protein NP233_g476 [Leucocoprinus birnbaumii]
MPIAHKRPKAKPTRPKLVDLGNVALSSLNDIIPSDAETRKIKASLNHAILELEQLESNISRTQRRLDSLRSRRDALLGCTERYQIAIAPYKRLPPEILREIFFACLPETVHLPPRLDEAPLLLTRVCSSWRMLALSTQELWCNFEVALSARARRNYHAMGALNTWLSRCPDRPISFRIHAAPRAPFPLPGIRHPILPIDLIIPHTFRIRTLDLQNISGEQMYALITLPLGSFPMLETFDIFLRDSWMFRVEPWEATAFQDAKRLRSVAIRGFDGTFNPAALNLPWDQLRILHLDTLLSDPVGCHAMLTLCAELQEASIRIMRIEDSSSRLMARLPPTRLPKLRSLLVRFESTASHGKFMKPLELPALHTLQTRFDWRNDAIGSDDATTSCYTDLIERSACPIQRLSIGRNSLELDFGRLLEVARDLRELGLADHVRVPTEVWAKMGRGELGAKLERLAMDVALVDPLLNMLEARVGLHRNANGAQCILGGLEIPSCSCLPRASESSMVLDNAGEPKSVLKEIKLGCPKPNFQQKWRMECLEKAGLKIWLCHYGFFER